MTTAMQVASYLLWKVGDYRLSNRELLKILYYAQGWYLGIYGKPLFNQKIEAWPQGPVQPAVYGQYKHNYMNPIKAPVDPPSLPQPIREHLDRIAAVFGDKGDQALVKMTHAEPTWQRARHGLEPNQLSNNEISAESMREYFSGLLHGAEIDPRLEWAREALMQRFDEERKRFSSILKTITSRNKDALEDLASR